MFDILLDPLPEDYNGFLIRPDYRIGIQIALCLQDEDLSENDRVVTAISLLFGRGLPPLETAVEGLGWFMRCGAAAQDAPDKAKQCIWFDFDAGRICSSFRKSFGIDIHKQKMHWFEFMELLGCVDEDSALSHAIQIRGTDTSGMKPKQKAQYERLKKKLTPPVKFTKEEQEAIDEFWAQIK